MPTTSPRDERVSRCGLFCDLLLSDFLQPKDGDHFGELFIACLSSTAGKHVTACHSGIERMLGSSAGGRCRPSLRASVSFALGHCKTDSCCRTFRGIPGIYIKSGEGNGGDTWWDSGIIQKVPVTCLAQYVFAFACYQWCRRQQRCELADYQSETLQLLVRCYIICFMRWFAVYEVSGTASVYVLCLTNTFVGWRVLH